MHCAQGRSRSAVVSVAYAAVLLSAAAADDGLGGEKKAGAGAAAAAAAAADRGQRQHSTVAGALEQVQLGRRMAEPNPSFLEQLRAHEAAGLFVRLAKTLDKVNPK